MAWHRKTTIVCLQKSFVRLCVGMWRGPLNITESFRWSTTHIIMDGIRMLAINSKIIQYIKAAQNFGSGGINRALILNMTLFHWIFLSQWYAKFLGARLMTQRLFKKVIYPSLFQTLRAFPFHVDA